MKRMTQWAVALLVLLLTAAGALAEVDTTVLTAEPWVNSDGMTLIFSDGGKGQMINVQNMAFDTTWTASGDSITYTFSFYGEHSYTLTMAQENDVPTLTLNDTGAVYMRKADFEKLAEQKQSEGANFYDLKLGEEVDLGFVKLTFTGAHTSRKIGEETYRVADGGTQFFCLTGSIENTGKAEVSSNMIRCEVVINGEYTYSASTDFLFGGAVFVENLGVGKNVARAFLNGGYNSHNLFLGTQCRCGGICIGFFSLFTAQNFKAGRSEKKSSGK